MTDAELIEPIAVPDVYVDGIASVEFVTGNNVRITYYADQKVEGRPRVRIICARIVRPLSSIISGQLTEMLRQETPPK